jgi:hypothetical protein
MRKPYIFYLAVAVLAFLMGCVASRLLESRARPRIQLSAPRTDVLTPIATRPRTGQWKRIKIGRVSFDVPAKMKVTGSPGGEGIVNALIQKESRLYVYYAYGSRVPSDSNPSPGRRKELAIDGRPGTLNIWRPLSPLVVINLGDLEGGMLLVIPDVGDGKNKFELYCVAYDMTLIKQVIDSVHFAA